MLEQIITALAPWVSMIFLTIAAWSFALTWLWQYYNVWFLLLFSSVDWLMAGRRPSTQFYFCYVGLTLSSLLSYSALTMMPVLGEVVFMHYGLGLLFSASTLMMGFMSGLLALGCFIHERIRHFRGS